MSERKHPMDEYPVGTWIPHKPDTWPFVFAIVKEPTKFSEWIGHKRDEFANPIMIERWIPAGTKVKIVMVSRFGDVGITDDLEAFNGYAARVSLDDLDRASLNPDAPE